MTSSKHATEITALLGNFLSKYDETATTGLERLCIVLEQQKEKEQQQQQMQQMQQQQKGSSNDATSSSSSSSSSSFASSFVHNEQVCSTFAALQQRPRIDFGLYLSAVLALIQNCDRRDRVYCIHRLCSVELFNKMRRILSRFDPEHAEQRGGAAGAGGASGKMAGNFIPVQHVERCLQVSAIIIKLAPRLLSTRLGINKQTSTSQQQQQAAAADGNNRQGGGGGVVSSIISAQQQQQAQAQSALVDQNQQQNRWTLPLDFPVFSASWFPAWCQKLREFRAEYILAAISHPLREVSRSALLQPKVLSFAIQEPAALAATPTGEALLTAILRCAVSNLVLSTDITTAQKCEAFRSQRALPKALAACLAVVTPSGNFAKLAQSTIRAMIDNVVEPSANYNLSSSAAELGLDGAASASSTSSTSLSNLILQSAGGDDSNPTTSTGGKITSLLSSSASSASSPLGPPRANMPNFWMLVLLRSLSPEKRAADANLTCYVLTKCPELFRPYISRVSSHLLQRGEQRSLAMSTARVATCNALSRILCAPLPFHLTSATVATVIFSSSSASSSSQHHHATTSTTRNSTQRTTALYFYDMTPQAATDEVCPSWMAEFCHKIIVDQEQNVLEFLFVLQVVRAALQRASAVRTSLQRIFDYNEQQRTFAFANNNNNRSKSDDNINNQGINITSDVLAEAAEWTAEATFMAEFDRLLHTRLPRIETIISRLQNRIVPELADEGSPSFTKFQVLAQRSYVVLGQYLAAFDKPFSVTAALPTKMIQSASSCALALAYQTSTISSIAELIRTSYDFRVEHLARLHHVDAVASASTTTASSGSGAAAAAGASSSGKKHQQNKKQQPSASSATKTSATTTTTSATATTTSSPPLPLLAQLVVWGIRAVRFIKNVDDDELLPWSSSQQDKTHTSSPTSAIQRTLVQVRDVLVDAVRSVLVDTGGSAHVSQLRAEVNVWLEHLTPNTVHSFFRMLGVVMGQSKSNAADTVASQLLDADCGALAAAARNFVSRGINKHASPAAAATTTTTTPDQAQQEKLLAEFAVVAEAAAVDCSAAIRRLRKHHGVLVDVDIGGGVAADDGDDQQQQHHHHHHHAAFAPPSAMLNRWSEECSMGVASADAIAAQQLNDQQRNDGADDDYDNDATDLVSSSRQLTSVDAFVHLLQGDLDTYLPYSSASLLFSSAAQQHQQQQQSDQQSSAAPGLLDVAALSKLGSAKAWRRYIPLSSSSSSAEKTVLSTVWTSGDVCSVWHFASLLLSRAASAASEHEYFAFAKSVLETWRVPKHVEQQQQQHLQKERLILAGNAVLLLVCVHVVFVFPKTKKDATSAPDDVPTKQTLLNLVDSILSLYGGSRSFTDRVFFSLLNILEAHVMTTDNTPPTNQDGDDDAATTTKHEEPQQHASISNNIFARKRFILGVGPASAADADSRFPELQVLHAIFDSVTEGQFISDVLLGMSPELMSISPQQDQEHNIKKIVTGMFRLVYPEIASKVWINNATAPSCNSSSASIIQSLARALNVKSQLSTDVVSSSALSFDPRYLVPLIHSVMCVRSQRPSIVDVPSYFCARSLPLLVRATSFGDDRIRRLAFDSLALCYAGLHPMRRTFIDAINVALRSDSVVVSVASAAPTSSSASSAGAAATSSAFPRIATAVTAVLVKSMPVVSKPQLSLYESVQFVVGEGLLEHVHKPTPFPMHHTLATISPDTLIASGAPFVDVVNIPPTRIPSGPGASSSAAASAGANSKGGSGGAGGSGKKHQKAPLHRAGFHRELDFLLTALAASCATEADFSALHDTGVFTQVLSLFHVVADFTTQARATVNTVVSCVAGPGAMTTTNKGFTRVLFAQHCLQWAVSALATYSASSTTTSRGVGASDDSSAADNNNDNKNNSTSAVVGARSITTITTLTTRNANNLCNLLIEMVCDMCAVLCTVSTWSKPSTSSVMLVVSQLVQWVNRHAGSVGSSRLLRIMETLLMVHSCVAARLGGGGGGGGGGDAAALDAAQQPEVVSAADSNKRTASSSSGGCLGLKESTLAPNLPELRNLVAALSESATGETARMLDRLQQSIA